MGKMIVLDEFYVTVQAPAGLPAAEYWQIRKALHGPFRLRLKETLQRLGDRYRALKRVRVKLSR